MKINYVDVHEIHDCGVPVIKLTSVVTMEHIFTYPEIQRVGCVPKRVALRRLHTVLTAYLDKPSEISEGGVS